jgi:hypothetical protein
MTPNFAWPEHKRAALSFSFDDARASQVDNGLPILDAHGITATFYVLPTALQSRLGGWQQAVCNGHEIGNHTVSHPCSAGDDTVEVGALENYTLERIQAELEDADQRIELALNITPRSFAYPCGQSFVGKGTTKCSYTPLVAQRFVAGRGCRGDGINQPLDCDLSNLTAASADGLPLQEISALIDAAIVRGGWLVLVAHSVGDDGVLKMQPETLQALCAYARQRTDMLWIDTVSRVAGHLAQTRNKA